jgi:ribulose kinase
MMIITKSNGKPCISCGVMVIMEEYTKCAAKCGSCHTKKDTGVKYNHAEKDISDDDTDVKYKKLKKRVKQLEEIVAHLSARLADQEKKTAGVEGLIDGFALGIRTKQVSDNIVELDG